MTQDTPRKDEKGHGEEHAKAALETVLGKAHTHLLKYAKEHPHAKSAKWLLDEWHTVAELVRSWRLEFSNCIGDQHWYVRMTYNPSSVWAYGNKELKLRKNGTFNHEVLATWILKNVDKIARVKHGQLTLSKRRELMDAVRDGLGVEAVAHQGEPQRVNSGPRPPCPDRDACHFTAFTEHRRGKPFIDIRLTTDCEVTARKIAELFLAYRNEFESRVGEE